MSSSEPASRQPPSRDQPSRDAFGPAEVSIILRRAIDLAGDRHTELGESLSASDLAAVAGEAGIPPAALAAALSEARAGLESKRSLADRLIGPAKVAATTNLPSRPATESNPGAPDRSERRFGRRPELEQERLRRSDSDEATAAANLRRWLEVEHGLVAYVRQDGVVVASRRGGVAAALGAGLRRIQGTGALNRVRSIQAAATTVDESGTVCVVADVSNRRTEAIVGGSAVTGSSMAAIGLVAVVAGPLALIAVPAAVAAGIGTARTAHRRTVDRVGRQVAFTAEAAVSEAKATHPAKRLLPASIGRRSRQRREPR